MHYYFFIANLIYYIFILNPIFIGFFAFLGEETRDNICFLKNFFPLILGLQYLIF